jgi:type II secretory pathway pseudopilin PulG
MIVILIISILLAMALPNFIQSRDNSRKAACITNLREIADAKDQWAMDTKAADTATPASTDLAPNYINVFPVEPQSGTYTIGNMDTPPTCSYASEGHILPEIASN